MVTTVRTLVTELFMAIAFRRIVHLMDQAPPIGQSDLGLTFGFVLGSSVRVFLKNAQHILDRLRVLVCAVVGRDDVFGLSTIHM